MDDRFSDEMLMAFADGRLDEPEFSAIAAAIETDPALAARLEALAVGGQLAKAVYGPLADRPVPWRLRQGVASAIARAEGSGAAKADGRPAWRRRQPAVWAPTAIAAGIAAIVMLPAGFLIGLARQEAPAVVVGEPLRGAVAELLSSLPSGGEQVVPELGVVRAIASVTPPDGGLCREFEIDAAATLVAVACRDAGTWTVAVAVGAPAVAEGFAPASSLDAIEAYLMAIEAGPPLPPAEERAALAGP